MVFVLIILESNFELDFDLDCIFFIIEKLRVGELGVFGEVF